VQLFVKKKQKHEFLLQDPVRPCRRCRIGRVRVREKKRGRAAWTEIERECAAGEKRVWSARYARDCVRKGEKSLIHKRERWREKGPPRWGESNNGRGEKGKNLF